jgi:hypothetical protein
VLFPTATLAPVTPTPKFAPFCGPDPTSGLAPSQCRLPIAEQSSVFCQDKSPYNLIYINEGATYELFGEGFRCSDAGVKDGKMQVICTGPMALPFELKVCDPACALPVYQPEVTDCPEEYVFDDLRSCCTKQPLPADQNCVVLKLETKSCVINCGVYKNQSSCEKNFFACNWDDENEVCKLRK